MSEQPRCDGTSNGSIPNTSPAQPTPLHAESDKSDKKRQKRQHATGDGGDGLLVRFQPSDLKSLTFKSIGSEQDIDIWHASPADFHVYVSQYAQGFRRVNTEVWPLAERLMLVNVLWDYCQHHGHPFPFAERQQMVPDVNVDAVPLVNDSVHKSALQADGGQTA